MLTPDPSAKKQTSYPVGDLSQETLTRRRERMLVISPDDGKYAQPEMEQYLSADAEWRACARVQRELLAVRVEFGQAAPQDLERLDAILGDIDTLNIALLEDKVTKHDQLAVLEELGRLAGSDIKALLHPGTTSYDVLDTARSFLFKSCWREVMRPKIASCVNVLADMAEVYANTLQTGRTHLQRTSPVTFGMVLSQCAARMAERVERCDQSFGRLKGKISGIVGSGASVEMVIGEGCSLDFERAVLSRFGLEPDYTATQIVQKEALTDVGHALVSMMHVLGGFANDMRMLYSSEINEVTSRDGKQRLGGSSADASKNNPINWENIAGNVSVVESGMVVLYSLMRSDFQRDLRNSKGARYQPHLMMTEVYESFGRAVKALEQLSVNEDMLAGNLKPVREFPSEALVAILRAHAWQHPVLGVGHDAVKEFSKVAKREKQPLLEVALRDEPFAAFFKSELSDRERRILQGELELYLGTIPARILTNLKLARDVAARA